MLFECAFSHSHFSTERRAGSNLCLPTLYPHGRSSATSSLPNSSHSRRPLASAMRSTTLSSGTAKHSTSMGAFQGDVEKLLTPRYLTYRAALDLLLWSDHLTETLVSTTTRGTVLTKTPSEFHALLKKLARSNDQCPMGRRSMQTHLAATSTIEIEAIKARTMQMTAVQ